MVNRTSSSLDDSDINRASSHQEATKKKKIFKTKKNQLRRDDVSQCNLKFKRSNHINFPSTHQDSICLTHKKNQEFICTE